MLIVKIIKNTLNHEKLRCINDIDDSFGSINWQPTLTSLKLLIEKFGRLSKITSATLVLNIGSGRKFSCERVFLDSNRKELP